MNRQLYFIIEKDDLMKTTIISLSILVILLMPGIGKGEKSIKKTEVNPVQQARELINSKKLEEAINILQGHLPEIPANLEAHYLLGLAYLYQINEVAAREVFAKAVETVPELGPRMAEAYFEAGSGLIHVAGKRHIGMHYLNRALQRDSSMETKAGKLFYKGGFEALEENRFMAHQLLKRALELNPSYETEDRFYVAYRVDSVTNKSEIVQGGESFLMEKRFSNSPFIPHVLYHVAEAYADMGKKTQALIYYQILIDEHPETEYGLKAKRETKE